MSLSHRQRTGLIRMRDKLRYALLTTTIDQELDGKFDPITIDTTLVTLAIAACYLDRTLTETAELARDEPMLRKFISSDYRYWEYQNYISEVIEPLVAHTQYEEFKKVIADHQSGLQISMGKYPHIDESSREEQEQKRIAFELSIAVKSAVFVNGRRRRINGF